MGDDHADTKRRARPAVPAGAIEKRRYSWRFPAGASTAARGIKHHGKLQLREGVHRLVRGAGRYFTVELIYKRFF